MLTGFVTKTNKQKTVHAGWLCYEVSMLDGFVTKKKCPCWMALLGSVHVGFVRSEENESQQTFHKALCYLCNRELKTTCSSMIACACGMNKWSVECECVCMQLMSDWSVDGMTAIVLHWLCATQVKKLTVLSYYKAHKYSSKLILHHPVSPVIQRVCVCAHVCVCVCVCVRALV